MLVTVLLFALALCAAVTDVWRHKIYNWNTYSGIVAGLTLNALGTALGYPAESPSAWDYWVGSIPLAESLLGFLACGFCLLVCFVFFRIGGGDVKLMAMLGTWLGLERGIETLLWTLVLGAAMGLVVLIWRVGFWRLVSRAFRQFMATLRLGWWSPLSEEDRRELQPMLFLAPSALAALTIVHFSLVERLVVA